MELVSIVEEFGRLWDVPGFAELFCARLAASPESDRESDPCEIVLAAHHAQLVDASRQALGPNGAGKTILSNLVEAIHFSKTRRRSPSSRFEPRCCLCPRS